MGNGSSTYWEENLFPGKPNKHTQIDRFAFLSNWFEYDSGDNFLFEFELNGIPFGSELKEKLSSGFYSIQFERKWILFL